MRDTLDMLKQFHLGRGQGFRFALATIVSTEGSTYQKAGAKMLVRNDGLRVGLLSGGCLENDIVEAALLAMGQGESRFLSFDHSDEADKTLGTSLGCRGKIVVWITPVAEHIDTKTFAWWIGRCAERYTYTSWTILDSSHPDWVGARCFMLPGFLKTTAGDIPWRDLESTLSEAPTGSRPAQRHNIATPSGWCDVLVESFAPPVRLLLWGLGVDAEPVYRLAVELGWEVVGFDHRPVHAQPDRFPDADHIQTARPDILQRITTDARTGVLIMSHHYPTDLAVLQALQDKTLGYIGLLGPVERRQQLFADMDAEGTAPSPSFQERVYGPAGLKLGGRTAADVALSVVAEIQAVFHHKDAPHLRDTGSKG